MAEKEEKNTEQAKAQNFSYPFPGMELARAYFLIQQWGKVYSLSKALEKGTLFPDLYRPYPY